MGRSKVKAFQLEGDSTKVDLWNSLATTPPEYLKDFTRPGGFSGKSVDPVWRIMMLTRTFGPCGMGWGFVQEDQWVDAGAGPYVAYVRGHIWYEIGGERYQTMSHTGGTIVGDRNPDEAYKMSETDALGKCCLDLGMCADLYLGQHDLDKYQSEPGQAPQRRGTSRQPNKGAAQNRSTPPAESVEPITKGAAFDLALAKIEEVKDDVEALAMQRRVYRRLSVSKDLSPEELATIAERILLKRAGFVPAEAIDSFQKAADAFVKLKFIGADKVKAIIGHVRAQNNLDPEAKDVK